MQHNGTQSEFVRALLARQAPPASLRLVGSGEDLDRRFGVYRNNVFAGLVSVLAARFPATQTLVGEDFFSGMAAAYVSAHPPKTPVMMEYGGGFADFVSRFGPAQEIPYLADVAALEWLRHTAHHAADAEPLTLAALAALDPAKVGDARVTLHPSVRLFASDYPAVSLWRVNTACADAPDELSGAEAALVVRPDLSVQIHDLSPAAYAFLSALSAGASLGAAVASVQRNDPNFDLAQSLAFIFSAGAIAAVAAPD